MNRRDVLGLAAAAALTTGCSGEKTTPLKRADPAVRQRMRALALPLLLTSDTLRQQFFNENLGSPKYGNGAANHPFDAFNNDIDRGIYLGILKYVNDHPGDANLFISQIGTALGAFAGAVNVGNYMPPDCPCQAGEAGYCPPVSPLLA